MASKNRIPYLHRDHAAPDDVLARIGQPEANRRAKAVFELHRSADGIKDAEVSRATHALAERMRKSPPYLDHIAEVGQRKKAMADLGSGALAAELRRGHLEALDKLNEDHAYPRDIEEYVYARGATEKVANPSKPQGRRYAPGSVSRKGGWCPWDNCGIELSSSEAQAHYDMHEQTEKSLAEVIKSIKEARW